MKSTGIVRNIDELGRVVVPKEMHKHLGIENGDPVEIGVEGERIVLCKYEPTCVFCGSNEDVLYYKGKKICRVCMAELKELNA